jgi:predicted Mrr-cat superfamily restriction endonuclease
VGDAMRAKQADLPLNQKDYWAFAHEMAIGDKVLVIVQNFPVAVATIAGEYNYIREREPELGVWFRHFRRVKDVRYYADRVTNAAAWQQLTMTDTISPLRDPNSASYKLISKW